MEQTTTFYPVIVIAIFALIAIFAFTVYKMRTKIKIKGPFNTAMELTSEDKPNEIRLQRAESSNGGVEIKTNNRSVTATDVKAKDSIVIESNSPRQYSKK